MLKLCCSFFFALLILSFYPRLVASEAADFNESPGLLTAALPEDQSAHIQAASLQPGHPKTLTIAKIKLAANIVSVTLTNEGIVDTPSVDVGWYREGAKPGSAGTANLNGHIRDSNGQPGIFYNLSQLEVGDVISVTDDLQQQFHYRITATELVDVNEYPVAKVYSNTGKATLNLTTCAGLYNPNRQDYTKRTIIYSELVE